MAIVRVVATWCLLATVLNTAAAYLFREVTAAIAAAAAGPL
jgi:hypothetical protein